MSSRRMRTAYIAPVDSCEMQQNVMTTLLKYGCPRYANTILIYAGSDETRLPSLYSTRISILTMSFSEKKLPRNCICFIGTIGTIGIRHVTIPLSSALYQATRRNIQDKNSIDLLLVYKFSEGN